MKYKIKNSSRWPKHFVRRMLAWCIKETDLEPGRLRRAEFRTRNTTSWSGHASSSGRIVVSIGPANCYPAKWNGYKRACKPSDGSDYMTIADPLEGLVAVTAHELGHIGHFGRGHYGRGSEDLADPGARAALKVFREQRAELEAEWSRPPKQRPAVATASIADKRKQKAQAMLKMWQRKSKLANNKVRKYSRRLRYYERLDAPARPERMAATP